MESFFCDLDNNSFFFFLIYGVLGSYGEVYHADWNGTVSFFFLFYLLYLTL